MDVEPRTIPCFKLMIGLLDGIATADVAGEAGGRTGPGAAVDCRKGTAKQPHPNPVAEVIGTTQDRRVTQVPGAS